MQGFQVVLNFLAEKKDVFSAAFDKHLKGELVAAEALYRDLIYRFPDDPEIKHYLGFLLQQTNRLAEAQVLLTTAITLDGSHSVWHFNLAIVLSRQGQITAAIDAFSCAIAIDADRYFYWTNLGVSFELNNEGLRAEQCFNVAINIDPNCPDAYYLLAALCLKQARFEESKQLNYRGIILDPQHGNSKILLGQAYYELGRINDAISVFENWLAIEPGHPVAIHLLAAYQGQKIPEQCTSQYIEQTFDQFAGSFDSVLGRLNYCGPDRVQAFLEEIDVPRHSLSVLDLGCGTGLIGVVLHSYAHTLIGVDLSVAMLSQAAQKQCYHQLHATDILSFLRACTFQYDLIVCMDTFIYFGRLEEVFKNIYQHLKVGGRFIFSTEKLSGDVSITLKLNISGRYSHHPDYLVSRLNKAGFVICEQADVVIRKESGCPIDGQFFSAMRTQ